MASLSSPRDKKKAAQCRGIVLYEDEASFWLDGTLHRTWARVGDQPRVPTFGMRKTAHVFGAVALEDASFSYRFARVFNGQTFWAFLKQLVRRFPNRKVFLITDNGPCHNLTAEGKAWLYENRDRLSLHRLPPYSPEFNPMEPVCEVDPVVKTGRTRFCTNGCELPLDPVEGS